MSLKLLSKITATVLALTVVAAPAATAGTTPVGTWDATVELSEGAHKAKFAFGLNGKACLEFGSPDEASGTGTGTWWRTGPNRFAFTVVHTVYLPGNMFVGTVEVNQQAQQNSNTFSSSGTSKSFAPDGTPTGSGTAKVSATRTSAIGRC